MSQKFLFVTEFSKCHNMSQNFRQASFVTESHHVTGNHISAIFTKGSGIVYYWGVGGQTSNVPISTEGSGIVYYWGGGGTINMPISTEGSGIVYYWGGGTINMPISTEDSGTPTTRPKTGYPV